MSLHSKRSVGRTSITDTPLRIRVSGVDLTPKVIAGTHALLGRRLARFGTWIERVDVRFKDINGPARGGVDTRCRINLAIAGRPSVFAEERADDAGRALARAAVSVSRAMKRSVERKGLSAPATKRMRATPTTSAKAANEHGARASSGHGRGGRSRRHRRGMVYKLEESARTPSRKSTRKSASRQKGSHQLRRSAQRRKHTPKARAMRARARR